MEVTTMEYRINFLYDDIRQHIPEFVDDIREIYSKMSDDISRDIFTGRLLLSLTGDQQYMQNVLRDTEGGKKLSELLERNEGYIYIYGAGVRGKRLVETFPHYRWSGIIDKNKNIEGYHNVKVIDLEQFMDIYTRGIKVIVSNMFETDEIVEDLKKQGIDLEDIYILNDFDHESAKDMYFPLDNLKQPIEDGKIFVDVGCYDGRDSLNYLKWVNDEQAKIYAFEPDKGNYEKCRENLKNFSNINLLNIGLSDAREEIGINGSGEMAHLVEDKEQSVHTQLLDEVVGKELVGYIKMDIEGFEERALRGAVQTIQKQHPMLAISIYHKQSDIWRIPKLLLELNNKYCFYMRHYSTSNADTVLYAIDNRG